MKSHRRIAVFFVLVFLFIMVLQSVLVSNGYGKPQSVAAEIAFEEHLIDENIGLVSGIKTADMNDDSYVDILVAAFSSIDIQLWQNDGSADFAMQTVEYNEIDGYIDAFPYDIDDDGDMDVAGASGKTYDMVGWWENDGNENFTEHNLDTGLGFNDVYVADLDRNGYADVLATGTTENDVLWYENSGDGSFHKNVLSDEFDLPYDVIAADLDGNRTADVIVGGSNSLGWWKNDGGGLFSDVITIDSGIRIMEIQAIDLDRDGDMDIIGTLSEINQIVWWENDGNESFERQVIKNNYATARSVYAADLDGDLDIDVIGTSYGDDEITWWENDGQQVFEEHTIKSYFDKPRDVTAGDLDRDGDLDIITGNYDGRMIWFENNASDAWSDLEVSAVRVTPSSPEVMEGTSLEIDITNLGPDFESLSGTIYLDLYVRDTDTGDRWIWRYPGSIDSLLTNDTKTFTIDTFWFTREEIDSIEACIYLEDGEANPSNNCLEQPITIDPRTSNPWLSCVSTALDATVFGIDAVTNGSLLAMQEVGVLMTARTPTITAACSGAEADADTCMIEWAKFGIDAVVLIAKEASPHKAAIALVKDALMMLWSASDCGIDLTQAYLRGAMEEARHEHLPLNAVVARSPVYIRAVDSNGNRAGYLDDGTEITEIDGAEMAQVDGSKVVLYPGLDTNRVEITGTDTGAFDLIISVAKPDSTVHTVIYEDVPITAGATGEVDMAGEAYTLSIDDTGDGIPDRQITPSQEYRTSFQEVNLPLVER